ncbi:MAG TPA: 2-C-methyl-D-erythritol 4-phosphate cytidylyltransferase [Burkholderiaceae bacterium]|jgi:2-C-methyl-D-erythritol 4-phosphate cytidylyltransferase
MTTSRYFALIPAAGVGERLGVGFPKQYMPINGKSMLLHVLDTFAATDAIVHIYLIVSAEDAYIDEILSVAPHLAERVTVMRNGGATRHDSVLNGLHAMRDHVSNEDWILVHDAARPGLTSVLINKLIQELHDDPVGGLLALPIVDTLKRADANSRAEATVPRDSLWAAQTPQMFRYALLQRALMQVKQVTDEASAIEALGLKPKLVEGSARNLKVTLSQDIALAELLLKGIA